MMIISTLSPILTRLVQLDGPLLSQGFL